MADQSARQAGGSRDRAALAPNLQKVRKRTKAVMIEQEGTETTERLHVPRGKRLFAMEKSDDRSALNVVSL